MNIKVPTSAAEMEEIRKIAAGEITGEALAAIVGGNDIIHGKPEEGEDTWICPFCGAVVPLKQMQDAAKHMTQDCPNNPYKDEPGSDKRP